MSLDPVLEQLTINIMGIYVTYIVAFYLLMCII